MTGATPNTAWLDGCVALDAHGFIKTRPDLSPGVFAVGDVRCGNVKRVASAVGEGSIAVAFVHRCCASSCT